METKDLMIGDIVQVNKDVCIKKGTIVRVTAIDEQDSLVNYNLKGSAHCVNINDDFENGGVWVAYLEPIPLTAEILEKNGFVYNNIPFIRGWEQFGLLLYAGGNGYRINCGTNIALIINSVHELQHALRLCGIDKEIVI